MTLPIILGGLLFSGIGFVAFRYGRSQSLPKALCLGVLLMTYVYFVSDVLWLYVIGCALTACLFIFKD